MKTTRYKHHARVLQEFSPDYDVEAQWLKLAVHEDGGEKQKSWSNPDGVVSPR